MSGQFRVAVSGDLFFVSLKFQKIIKENAASGFPETAFLKPVC